MRRGLSVPTQANVIGQHLQLVCHQETVVWLESIHTCRAYYITITVSSAFPTMTYVPLQLALMAF